MVLFVWTEEIKNSVSPTCKTWFPIAVVDAKSEREAWETLYQSNDTLWWVLQGATNYREMNRTSNLAEELYQELKKNKQYKTNEAQQPTISGNCATKKSNY